jgi:glycosyltransferase involved in cell wall biosynthesis
MRLTVVTVCMNARGTIGEALASIHRQSFRSVEHIVIDGASRDGTVEVLEAHRAGISHLVSEPDQGLYFAMNKGIALATGEFLGFLNADDIYADVEVLQKVATVLQSGAVDAVYGDLVYVRQSEPDICVRYWKSRPYEPGLIERGWMPAHPTLFVRTAILKKLGGFDTRYRYQSDYELIVRLFLKERITAAYIPEVLVRMRTGGHTNRSLRNIIRGNLEAYRACRENGVKVSPLFVLQKMASRLPQFFRRPPMLTAHSKTK